MRTELDMRGRSVFVAAAPLLLSLIIVACSGGDGQTTLPTTGAAVCDRLNEADRFRYALTYIIDSPQQESPPPDPAPGEPGSEYVGKPSQTSIRIAYKHAGAFVKPDRLDYEISLPDQPEQEPARFIRIGENEWVQLRGIWQVRPNTQGVPFPFTPPNFCAAVVAPLNLTGLSGALENVGDTKALHLQIASASLEASSQIYGSESDMGRLLKSYDVDLWLSEKDARLVKFEAVAKGTYPYGRELSTTFGLEVASYNDKSIEIEPPQL